MKNIIFIVLITLIFSVVYALLSVPFFYFNSLSTFWKVITLGMCYFLIGIVYLFLPNIINGLVKMISPNIRVAFYSTLLVCLILTGFKIFQFWTIPEYNNGDYGNINRFALSLMILGISTSFFIKKERIVTDGNENLYKTTRLGDFIFFPGLVISVLLLFFKLFSTEKINFSFLVNPEEVYPWYYGFYHGANVLPNWILSFFKAGIYYQSQNGTELYYISWWISFVSSSLFILFLIYKGLKEQ